MESSEKTKKSKASKKGKSKTDGKNKDIDSKKKRDLKGKELAATKPSYNLQRGSATMCTDLKSLQCLHQARLRGFLRKLVMRHNWDEVSGVLSVLMKTTCKDRSPSLNRTKYLVCMWIDDDDDDDILIFACLLYIYNDCIVQYCRLLWSFCSTLILKLVVKTNSRMYLKRG